MSYSAPTKVVRLGALVCSVAMSGALVSGCSQLESLSDGFKEALSEAATPSVEQEPALPVEKPNIDDNVNISSMADTPENRDLIARVVEAYYADIAEFRAEDEKELKSVQKEPSQYARIKSEEKIGKKLLVQDGQDIEEAVESLPPEEIDTINGYNDRFNPRNVDHPATNFKDLQGAQKAIAQMFLGDQKMLFNYTYRLNKLKDDKDTTKFTVSKDHMVFRDKDVVVNTPAGMTVNNGMDNAIFSQPVRVILVNGSWQVDVFNAAMINYSPSSIGTLFMDKDTPDDKAVQVVDDTLYKFWKNTDTNVGVGRSDDR